MRRKVFIDAAGWIGFLNPRDGLHKEAIRIAQELRRRKVRFVTTGFVLLEVADAFTTPPLREVWIDFVDSLGSSRALLAAEVVPVSKELFDKGWSLYSCRPDKDWGLTDCTSFAVMEEYGLTEAFTSDQHFTQTGYQKLL